MIKKSDLALTPGMRLTLLLCIFIVCYIISVLCVQLTMHLCGTDIAAAMRIGAVIQDVVSFIIPAIATTMIITRKPAELLCLSRGNCGSLHLYPSDIAGFNSRTGSSHILERTHHAA